MQIGKPITYLRKRTWQHSHNGNGTCEKGGVVKLDKVGNLIFIENKNIAPQKTIKGIA